MAEDEDGRGGSRAQWSLEAEEEEEPAGKGDRKGGGRSRKDTRKKKKQTKKNGISSCLYVQPGVGLLIKV